MNSPIIKAPTDLVFYFPTSAETIKNKSEAKVKSEAKQKSVDKAKSAGKVKPEAKVKSAAKGKPAAQKKAGKANKKARGKGGATKAEEPKAVKVKPSAKPAKKAPAPGRGKVVRDSFKMPKSDYLMVGAVKERCLEAGVSVKKSEILRAGLLLLAKKSPKQLLAAIAKIESAKAGRPPKA